MKYFSVFFSLLILSACVTSRSGQLKLVKVNHHELAVIDKSSTVSHPINQEAEVSISSVETDNFQKQDNNIPSETSAELNQSNQTKQVALNFPLPKKIELEPTDSLTAKDIENQALEAENRAKIALGFSIGGLSMIIPVLGFLGILSFVVGIVFYSKANKARYITPEGQKKLKVSKGLLIADGILIGVFLFILLIFLLLFSIFNGFM